MSRVPTTSPQPEQGPARGWQQERLQTEGGSDQLAPPHAPAPTPTRDPVLSTPVPCRASPSAPG